MMRRGPVRRPALFVATLCALSGCFAAAQGRVEVVPDPRIPATLVLESRAAIERGIGYLIGKQGSDGSWLHSPAVTALACMALHRGAAPKYGLTRQLAVEKGRRFILSNAREDGAICSEDRSYINYSTAICLSALAVLANPSDIEVLRKARHFLISSQLDEDHPEHPADAGDPFYGGIGYGSGGPTRPDLSNTQLALEALYLTDFLAREPYAKDAAEAKETDLAWSKALKFLAAVQNIDRGKDGSWVVTDERDGGFIYRPDQSKAPKIPGESGSMRSYGSMTYAGLKSMIYAQLERDDPRVLAAIDWARRHYTLDENPGVGAEGHYYYLHTFAKAHAVYGAEEIQTPDGRPHRWRVELVRKLLQLQKGSGEWHNEKSGRWQESVPELVTAYALLSLETALSEQIRTP